MIYLQLIVLHSTVPNGTYGPELKTVLNIKKKPALFCGIADKLHSELLPKIAQTICQFLVELWTPCDQKPGLRFVTLKLNLARNPI